MSSMEQSCITVRWKTEPPEFRLWRRSQYFHLLDSELCLELFFQYISNETYLRLRVVWLRKVPQSMKWFFTYSYVNVGSNTFFEETKSLPRRDLGQVHDILSKRVNVSQLGEIGEEWTILCQFSCNIRFEEQVEKKIIDVTTVGHTLDSRVDRCVQVSWEIPRDAEALSQDFSRLLEEQTLSDFELKCGDRIFPVHKTVLAARSDVFRAMFASGMAETETGSADIADLRADVLDLLLKFVYSGSPEGITVDTVADLYEAADRYAVRSLMRACSYCMIRNATTENCARFLKTADLHSDPDLKAGVAKFVLQHPDVFQRADWMEFSAQHPVLASEILQEYVSMSLLPQTPPSG